MKLSKLFPLLYVAFLAGAFFYVFGGIDGFLSAMESRGEYALLLFVGSFVVFGLLFGFAFAAREKSLLTSVHAASDADEYVHENAVRFSVREDRFSHTTEVRQPINRGNNGPRPR